MSPMNHALMRPKAGSVAVAPNPDPNPPANTGPTAVSFTNVTSTIAEDADTSSAIHLADIVVTDDGYGTNTLSISGDARFSLVGSALYLVAGASLDYETNTSHSTTVTATDDGGAGSAQATFVLAVQDAPEGSPPDAPTGVSVTVSEFSPPFAPTGVAVTVSEDADEFFSDTVLLLQDSLSDDSYQGHTVVASGTAGVSTDSAVGSYGFDIDNGSASTLNNYITISGSGTQAFEVGATEDVTVECWVKFIDDPTTSNYFQIIRPAGVLNSNSWFLRVYSSRINFISSSATTTSQLSAIQQNTWHHIACVRQAGTLKIYLDGTEVLSTPHTGTISTYGSSGYQGLGLGYYSANHFRLDGLRITIGTARYTSAFTPSGQPFSTTNGDPEFASVDLLLQDSFTDQSLSGQTVVVSGNAAASTTQVKVGTHSLYFDGSGDWADIANTAMAFGTGPFTVEFWMYWDGTVTGAPWMGVMGAHNASSGNTGRYAIFMNNGGISHYIQTAFPSATPISANTWHHIASTRDSSGSCRLFVDGALKSTVTDAGNLVFPQGFRVGNDFNPNRPPFSGYLDALRITKGVCRYTANFTPPTAEFPD